MTWDSDNGPESSSFVGEQFSNVVCSGDSGERFTPTAESHSSPVGSLSGCLTAPGNGFGWTNISNRGLNRYRVAPTSTYVLLHLG